MESSKPGIKTTEWIAMIVGVLSAVVPVIMQYVPQDSSVYVILGAIGAVVAYIGGRSYVKGTEVKARALVEAAKIAPPANPS